MGSWESVASKTGDGCRASHGRMDLAVRLVPEGLRFVKVLVMRGGNQTYASTACWLWIATSLDSMPGSPNAVTATLG